MKKHAKKALKHDVEVLGKTVPTLAIAALFLIGGGTAATLTYFGQVTGTADVDQAVLVDGSSGETTVDIFEQDSITAGDTVVDTFTIENNMDSTYNPVYDSTLDGASTIQAEGADIDWTDGGNQVGIDTTYANYFSDAGYEFADVELSSDSEEVDVVVDSTDGDNPDTISEGIDALSGEEDTVFVVDVDSSDGFVLDKQGVSVVSDGATVGPVEVSANDVEIRGFEIVGDGSDDGQDGVQADHYTGVTVAHNYIHDVNAGVYVQDSDTAVRHNTIEDTYAGVAGTENFEGEIESNVFKSNDEAIGVGDDEFSTEDNRFEDNTASFRIYDDGDEDLYSDGQSVDADNNFFAEPFNIDYNGNEDVTDVSKSYQTADSVPSGETVTVGVVNEFDLMVNGAYDYSLTTDIITS